MALKLGTQIFTGIGTGKKIPAWIRLGYFIKLFDKKKKKIPTTTQLTNNSIGNIYLSIFLFLIIIIIINYKNVNDKVELNIYQLVNKIYCYS